MELNNESMEKKGDSKQKESKDVIYNGFDLGKMMDVEESDERV